MADAIISFTIQQVKDTIIGKLEARRDELMATVTHQEEIIATQKEQLYGAEAEILRLQREVEAAERRAEDADMRAAACMRERDDAALGVEAANSAAAEEAVKRGVAWDMGKQHALSLMMESVAMRRGDIGLTHAAALGGGYLGGGFALSAATGDPAQGPSALRTASGGSGRGSSRSGMGGSGGGGGMRHSGHRSGPGHPGMA